MLIFALLSTLMTLTATAINLRAIEPLDTHDINPIDSNVNFCFTIDTQNINPIDSNVDFCFTIHTHDTNRYSDYPQSYRNS